MHEAFWDNVAPDYDAEIFNTLKSDRNDRLGKTIKRFGAKSKLACDFGCGVGRFLPVLLSCAKKVVATDFSAASLEIAKQQIGKRDQARVELLKRDLTKSGRKFCTADFGLLINVVIMPSADHRNQIFSNVWKNLRKGARLIVVAPSLESTLYSASRLIEWEERDGKSRRASENAVNRTMAKEVANLAHGIVRIDDTETKHHLAEELEVQLKRHRFRVLEKDKVEYDWSEDYESPPRWLKDPYPWDWLFVAEKE